MLRKSRDFRGGRGKVELLRGQGRVKDRVRGDLAGRDVAFISTWAMLGYPCSLDIKLIRVKLTYMMLSQVKPLKSNEP